MSGATDGKDSHVEPLVIGTRGSPLALAQTKIVTDFLAKRGVYYHVKMIKTTGDAIQNKPLYDVGGKALFSKELETALLHKTIHLAVHSLKDLETPRPNGLVLCAYLKRADPRDVLVTHFNQHENKVYGCGLQDLPKGAVVGTSAPRRMAQLLHHRPDLGVCPVRGNVGTRLSKLNTSSLSSTHDVTYDAILFAKAGLDRLGIDVDESAILSVNTMIPSAGQGIIALECCEEDKEFMCSLFEEVNDQETVRPAGLERSFVERLEGATCRSPVGIYAEIFSKHICLRAMLCIGKKVHIFEKTYDATRDDEEILDDFMRQHLR